MFAALLHLKLLETGGAHLELDIVAVRGYMLRRPWALVSTECPI
ncbi:hypothetical protein [Desulfoglaeba alkanexedens]|nr:hypothetical protein [Desulfoglaeba alkanexedens]